VERDVRRLDEEENIKASPFELLTATAYEIFNREKLPIAIIEVGMGGRTDATNILKHPLVTVISKIGLDHQAFLGPTIEDIAYQKAGIIKDNVPCIVDSTNAPSVLDIIRRVAKEHSATIIERCGLPEAKADQSLASMLLSRQYLDHQQTNLGLAFAAVKTASPYLGIAEPPSAMLTKLKSSIMPGRLQLTSLASLTPRKLPVLLDGAHNEDAAAVLASFVDGRLRTSSSPVTWLLAFSSGKPVQDILHILLHPGDSVVTAEFGPVDGMPWVKSVSSSTLATEVGKTVPLKTVIDSGTDLTKGLNEAVKVAVDCPMVVTGSLYLISDVLRLQRAAESSADREPDAPQSKTVLPGDIRT
jgi:dihydrofolate synthase